MMKARFAALVAGILIASSAYSGGNVSTSFTYQGSLAMSGAPVDGPFDFRFRLYDDATGGVQIGNETAVDGVNVSDGVFDVALDFGATALAGARWLEIDVREASLRGGMPEPYVTLSPRQTITASPYSIQTRGIVVSEDGQRVGIATDDPQDALTIGNGVDIADVQIRNGGLCIDSDGGCVSAGPGSLRVGAGGIHGTDSSNGNLFLQPIDGNVGIGTTNPSAKLHIAGGVRARGGAPGAFGGNNTGYAFSGNGGDNDSGLFSLGDGQVSIFTDAVERFRFSAAGLRFPDGSIQSSAAPTVLRATRSIDFGEIPPNSSFAATFPVANAEVGDAIVVTLLSEPNFSPVYVTRAWVRASGQVRIELRTVGNVPYDPPESSFLIVIFK